MSNKNREFALIEKKDEAENIVSLFFEPIDGRVFDFAAGQYVSVIIPSFSGSPKCYTISSSPQEKCVCLTVKKQGVFSSALIDSTIGDKFIFNGPYGNFYPEEDLGDLVFIAGGIGVTPFISIVKDRLARRIDPAPILLYSNKKNSDVAFFDKLNELAGSGAVDVVYFLTQDNKKNSYVREYSRIGKGLIKKYIGSVESKKYYICGSMHFIGAIWKDLEALGVPNENIFMESFY
ncbi:MAG: FAD-dependent oxidoreductase [Patescibacteria group bacterium]|nr:FAD-dependent oxidoreductase [Patescibacteria group bacterium]